MSRLKSIGGWGEPPETSDQTGIKMAEYRAKESRSIIIRLYMPTLLKYIPLRIGYCHYPVVLRASSTTKYRHIIAYVLFFILINELKLRPKTVRGIYLDSEI